MRRAVGLAAVTASLGLLATTLTAQTTYSDEALFLAAIANASTEDFEARAVGETPVDWSYLGGTATIQGADGVVNDPCCPGGAIGAQAYQGWPDLTPFMTFSSGVNAFGFFFIDARFPISIDIFGAALALLDSHDIPGGGEVEAEGEPVFFGVRYDANLVERVEITQRSGDAVTYDNVTVGVLRGASTVPEPATVALLGTGLLALGMAARRRRRKHEAID